MTPVTYVLRNEHFRRKAQEALAFVGFEPLMECVIRPHKAKRSVAQNDLYWQWLTIIAAHLGCSKDEVHAEYKRRFVLPILIRDDEEFRDLMRVVEEADSRKGIASKRKLVARLVSTTILNTKQFSEMMDEIQAHAASMDIRLPHPEDRYHEQT